MSSPNRPFATGAIMATCYACKQHQPVKMSINSGTDHRSFCTACYNEDKGIYDKTSSCAVCQSPGDIDYLHSVIFSQLPGIPIFAKVCCSSRCHAAVTRFAEESQEGSLSIICFTCKKDITHCRLQCSRCKDVFYCSRECQKIDWSTHKRTCQKVSHIPKIGVYNNEECMAIAASKGFTVKIDK
jgi:hypothetical protein